MTSNSVFLDDKPGTKLRWHYIIPTLLATQAVGMIDKVNVGIVMAFKPFLQEMHLTDHPAAAGLLMTFFLLAYGIGMPIWGAISDRIGPRKVGLTALLIWVLMLILGGISSNLTVLYISRIGLGFGEAFMWPICNNLTARWFPVSERSRANAAWVNGINLGVAVAGLLVTFVLSSLGWRPVFFILAALGLLPFIMFLVLVRDTPKQAKGISQTEIKLIETGSLNKGIGDEDSESIFKNYRFWLLSVADIASVTGVFGINTWIPTYLTQARHISMASMGLFTFVTWIVCMGVLYLMGIWSDRLMRRAPFCAISYTISGFALIGALAVTTTLQAMMLIALSIFAVQIGVQANHSLLHSIVKSSKMGLANGVMTGIANFFGAFAPFIMGALMGKQHNFLPSFIFLAVIGVIGGILIAILIPQENNFARSYIKKDLMAQN